MKPPVRQDAYEKALRWALFDLADFCESRGLGPETAEQERIAASGLIAEAQ